MSDQIKKKPVNPTTSVERVKSLSAGDLNDLCDATEAAIKSGGGFGWVNLPTRDVLERYWQGVIAMPSRILFVARLDGMICGTCQLVKPPPNNEAQSFSLNLTTNFVAPWARGHGLAKKLLAEAEKAALGDGYSVINLDVRETMTRAIETYESMGFMKFGTHPCYARVNGEIIKGIYYYKVIDPKAAV